MARLGDRFPAENRRAFAETKLVPGCSVRIDVKFPETTKPKFLVLVADDIAAGRDLATLLVMDLLHVDYPALCEIRLPLACARGAVKQ